MRYVLVNHSYYLEVSRTVILRNPLKHVMLINLPKHVTTDVILIVLAYISRAGKHPAALLLFLLS